MSYQIETQGNLTIFTKENQKIALLGTAHVSEDSAKEVVDYIETHRPDKVCIELCQKRYENIKDKERWQKMDIFQIIKDGKIALLLANLLLSSFQYRIGKKLNVKPGAEFIAAIESAEKISAEIVLIDRDIQITLKRTWNSLGFFKKLYLLANLGASQLFTEEEEITKEDIEKLKQGDALEEAVKLFAKEAPNIQLSLIDERDRFMASHLAEIEGQHIFAAVGAGHVPGMKKYIHETINRDELNIIPPPSNTFKIIKWIIPLVIIGIFIYGFTLESNTGLNMIYVWVLSNGIPSAIGAAIGGGTIISIITAFVAAPITSLNPMIGASMVVGLVEAYLRKPKVEDLETIQDAVSDMKKVYKNRFTRILLVAFLAGFGSSIGTFLGGYLIATGLMG